MYDSVLGMCTLLMFLYDDMCDIYSKQCAASSRLPTLQFNRRDYLLVLQAIFTDCVLNAFCGGQKDERLYSQNCKMSRNRNRHKHNIIRNHIDLNCELVHIQIRIYICVIV